MTWNELDRGHIFFTSLFFQQVTMEIAPKSGHAGRKQPGSKTQSPVLTWNEWDRGHIFLTSLFFKQVTMEVAVTRAANNLDQKRKVQS